MKDIFTRIFIIYSVLMVITDKVILTYFTVTGSIKFCTIELFCYGVHCFSKVANILRGDTSHGDTTILGEVDAVVLGDGCHLFWGHAGETEHSNLIGNVLPIT